MSRTSGSTRAESGAAGRSPRFVHPQFIDQHQLLRDTSGHGPESNRARGDAMRKMLSVLMTIAVVSTVFVIVTGSPASASTVVGTKCVGNLVRRCGYMVEYPATQ